MRRAVPCAAGAAAAGPSRVAVGVACACHGACPARTRHSRQASAQPAAGGRAGTCGARRVARPRVKNDRASRNDKRPVREKRITNALPRGHARLTSHVTSRTHCHSSTVLSSGSLRVRPPQTRDSPPPRGGTMVAPRPSHLTGATGLQPARALTRPGEHTPTSSTCVQRSAEERKE